MLLSAILAPAALGWSPSMAPLAPMAARSHIIVAQQPAEKMEENVVDELRSELRRAQLLSEAQALVIEQTSDSSNLKQELAKANQRMRDLQVQLSNERSITNELETALESTIRTVEAQDNELDEVYNDLHQVEADLADALKQLDAREPREPELKGSVVPTRGLLGNPSSRPHALEAAAPPVLPQMLSSRPASLEAGTPLSSRPHALS